MQETYWTKDREVKKNKGWINPAKHVPITSFYKQKKNGKNNNLNDNRHNVFTEYENWLGSWSGCNQNNNKRKMQQNGKRNQVRAGKEKRFRGDKRSIWKNNKVLCNRTQ